MRLGNETEAIRLLTDALESIPKTEENRPGIDFNNYRLGVAYLRLAETQNCALHPNAEACILPLRGNGIHRLQTPSRRAIDAFTAVLRSTQGTAAGGLSSDAGARNWEAGAPAPGRNDAAQQYLSALWLLNIAYMTVGGYPDEVPEPYRLPPETFRSTETMPRFANVAPALGLDTFDMCGGAVADDFDNDGYLDIVVSTWDTRGQIRYFRNNRDGTFTERTAEAGLLGLYGGLNLVPGRLRQRRRRGPAGPARRVAARERPSPELAAAKRRYRHVHRRDVRRGARGGALPEPDGGLGRLRQRRRSGTCTSATSRPRRWSRRASSFATTATARSPTLPRLPPS